MPLEQNQLHGRIEPGLLTRVSICFLFISPYYSVQLNKSALYFPSVFRRSIAARGKHIKHFLLYTLAGYCMYHHSVSIKLAGDMRR